MLRKGPSPATTRSRPEDERGFKLALPMTVQGRDPAGRDFEEETVLDYMSHSHASFILKNVVIRESQLKLIIGLPPKLSEDQDLKLIIRGRVAFLERRREGEASQRISLALESRYVIKPEAQTGMSSAKDPSGS
ncbi:PilZ domain-containing protein [bacterium]|nr:MAG: PilZ domain-containing protein [bacterium]